MIYLIIRKSFIGKITGISHIRKGQPLQEISKKSCHTKKLIMFQNSKDIGGTYERKKGNGRKNPEGSGKL